MEGLEVAEVKLSEVTDENDSIRYDSDFFKKTYLGLKAKLARLDAEEIGNFAFVSDGDHSKFPDNQMEEVRYLQAKDIKDYFIHNDNPVFVSKEYFSKNRRSHIREENILLSIMGNIGDVTITPKGFVPSMANRAIAIISRFKKFNPYFIFAYLISNEANLLIERLKTGGVQERVNLDILRKIKVPNLSSDFQSYIELIVKSSHQTLEESSILYSQAERTLLSELGLLHWQLPEPLTYEQRASEVFTTGRMDSEYFSPKYENLEAFLNERFAVERVGQWGKVLKGNSVEYTDDIQGVPVIRSGDLSDIEDDQKFLRAHPGQEMFLLKPNDVLISSIGFGSIGKVQVFDKQGKYATVSEVTVIRQERVGPYFLHFYLRSMAGQMQLNRHITGATGQLHLYPKDVGTVLVPIVTQELEQQLEGLFKSSRRLKVEAKLLLEKAKRAVEIAIEEDEATAMEFLEAESLNE